MSVEARVGDAVERLREMQADSVHCVVSSPPYWGLRDYGADGQIGLEPTPEEWCARMVAHLRRERPSAAPVSPATGWTDIPLKVLIAAILIGIALGKAGFDPAIWFR